ncbi:GNAT family N-acetyltransferase [Roseibium sp. RKSG952]|uniref:GNAT family N-acetyltransferase n=1 Tax=Roseibium sp. RKSG952 TaxID=2529384 RepID=UPI0012BCE00D|nr:GNAT family N-acetyltransferase [Roseibium sp. RKSG952]MTH97688.1 GNAT family N-acetyltransferase [Roseibium sp. RKSG952]
MSVAGTVEIAIETPLTRDMHAMIGELNAILRSLTPEEANYSMTAAEMAGPETTLFVARVGGKVAACGALHRHGGGVGELKRFYARPAYQGQGLARRILEEVTALALREGLSKLVLETGYNYEGAKRLYEAAGFTSCGPVLDYPENSYSIFYRKPLAPAGAGPVRPESRS